MAGADAFAGLGLGRREATWDAAAIDPHAMRDLPLFGAAATTEHPEVLPMIQEALPTLPSMPEGEAIGQNYGSTGLSLRKHPLALVEGASSERTSIPGCRSSTSSRRGWPIGRICLADWRSWGRSGRRGRKRFLCRGCQRRGTFANRRDVSCPVLLRLRSVMLTKKVLASSCSRIQR